MKRPYDEAIVANPGLSSLGSSSNNKNNDEADPPIGWEKRLSQKYQRHYWFNLSTHESSWEMPTLPLPQPPSVVVVSLQAAPGAREAAPKSGIKVLQGVTPIVSDVRASDDGWVKRTSTKYGRDYWFNDKTQETSWYDPAIRARLNRERLEASVDEPSLPRVAASTKLDELVRQLKTMTIKKTTDNEFRIIFTLPSEETSLITRCFQEDQILKTKLKLREGGKVVDLPSFWDVWKSDAAFQQKVLTSSDPHEAKWELQRSFRYKIATNFMPGYAKAIYEYFNAENVLDPCSGWGDRMTGAAASSVVKRYVCFDPNRALRPGYADTLQLFGHSVVRLDETCMEFSNNFTVHSLPFEVGSVDQPSDFFDLVFTSPPFFDYEMYSDNNPQYNSWIDEFYKPLFIQSSRCVKKGKHVAIHIGDTSAGNIERFLKEGVHTICDLKLQFKIGEIDQ